MEPWVTNSKAFSMRMRRHQQRNRRIYSEAGAGLVDQVSKPDRLDVRVLCVQGTLVKKGSEDLHDLWCQDTSNPKVSRDRPCKVMQVCNWR